ncbi:DNA cytosine methyltransferase [Rhizobium ruizarguesonis]
MPKTKETEQKAWRSPGSIRKYVLELRQKNTRTSLTLSDSIAKLHALGQEPESFLRGLGVSETDYRVLAAVPKLLARHIVALKDQRVDFDTLKALVEVGMRSRAKALRQITKGIPVDAEGVRAMEAKYQDRKTSAAAKVYALGRDRLKNALMERVQQQEAQFLESAATLLGEMRRFADEPGNTPRVRDSIIHKSGELLIIFESLFGSEFVPVEDWEILGSKDKLAKHYAQAHYALTELAAGHFHDTLPVIDPKDFRGPSPICEAALKRWTALDSVAFLSGVAPPPAPAKQKITRAVQRLGAIELCAGIGGQALGIQSAGFKLLGLYEKDETAVQTIAVNRPSWQPTQCDIREDGDKLLRDIAERLRTFSDDPSYRVDLIAAALPWRAWDGHGQGLSDPDDLLGTAKGIIEKLRPKSFFFEVAKEFEEARYLKDFNTLTSFFARLGYHTEIFRPHFPDFGIPQARGKIYLIGIQKRFAAKLKLPAMELKDTRGEQPKSSKKLHRRRTLGDILDSVVFAGRTRKRIGESGKEQLMFDKWAKYWTDTYGKKTKVPDLSRGLNNFRKPKAAKTPAPEVRADGTKRRGPKPKEPVAATVENGGPYLPEGFWETWQACGFDIRNRLEKLPGRDGTQRSLIPITPQVLKALQGYPMSWHLIGSTDEQINHVCEATPPVIALAIARAIYAALNSKINDSFISSASAIGADAPETRLVEVTTGDNEILKRWIRLPPSPLSAILNGTEVELKVGKAWHYGIRANRGELTKYLREDDVGHDYDDEDDHYYDGRDEHEFPEDDDHGQEREPVEKPLPGTDAASLVRRLL